MKNNQQYKQAIEKMKSKPEFENAAFYLGGVYSLLSIMCLWWDEAEENLKAAGGYGFNFKQSFIDCKKSMNKFEVVLRKYVCNWQAVSEEFEELEPTLRRFYFGNKTPELKSTTLKSVEEARKKVLENIKNKENEGNCNES